MIGGEKRGRGGVVAEEEGQDETTIVIIDHEYH